MSLGDWNSVHCVLKRKINGGFQNIGCINKGCSITHQNLWFFYRKTFQFQEKFLIKNSSTVSEYWWSGFIWMVQKLELQILHKIVPQAWKYHWKGFIWIVMPKPERFLDFFTAIKCMLPPFKPFYLFIYFNKWNPYPFIHLKPKNVTLLGEASLYIIRSTRETFISVTVLIRVNKTCFMYSSLTWGVRGEVNSDGRHTGKYCLFTCSHLTAHT